MQHAAALKAHVCQVLCVQHTTFDNRVPTSSQADLINATLALVASGNTHVVSCHVTTAALSSIAFIPGSC